MCSLFFYVYFKFKNLKATYDEVMSLVSTGMYLSSIHNQNMLGRDGTASFLVALKEYLALPSDVRKTTFKENHWFSFFFFALLNLKKAWHHSPTNFLDEHIGPLSSHFLLNIRRSTDKIYFFYRYRLQIIFSYIFWVVSGRCLHIASQLSPAQLVNGSKNGREIHVSN